MALSFVHPGKNGRMTHTKMIARLKIIFEIENTTYMMSFQSVPVTQQVGTDTGSTLPKGSVVPSNATPLTATPPSKLSILSTGVHLATREVNPLANGSFFCSSVLIAIIFSDSEVGVVVG